MDTLYNGITKADIGIQKISEGHLKSFVKLFLQEKGSVYLPLTHLNWLNTLLPHDLDTSPS